MLPPVPAPAPTQPPPQPQPTQPDQPPPPVPAQPSPPLAPPQAPKNIYVDPYAPQPYKLNPILPITPLTPTNFDKTFLGSFSLFNLINGNAWNYMNEGTKTVADKTVAYSFLKAIGQDFAASVLKTGAESLGAGAGTAATGYDALNYAIQTGAQQAVDNSPPVMGGAPVGDGLYMQDEQNFFGY